MASHHQHRPHIEPRQIAIAMRDDQTRRAIEARLTTPRHVTIKPSLLERAGDFLRSERGFAFYAGFYSGCMATVAMALIWAAVLS